MTRRLRVIIAGVIDAPVLKLDAPISIWGGIDQQTGRIIDRSHPQNGLSVAQRCLVAPLIRGSGGTPGNLAMLIKIGKAPAGIVIGYPDITVTAGIMVAERLYGVRCPMFVADVDQLQHFTSALSALIDQHGHYELTTRAVQ